MLWTNRRRVLDLSHHGCVMGILNVTPDSFSDGGRHICPEAAIERALKMADEGAEIVDIGGESTRPGSLPVDATEEIRRVLPVVAGLRETWDGLISIDTSKAEVARAALDAGADIVNDVTALRHDAEMAGVCAAARCGVVIMHMVGTPRTMQHAPQYTDVVEEVALFFRERMTALIEAGISPSAMCFDPGIGFGKTMEHNLELLGALERLAPPGRPLLLGVSRKSFIGMVLGIPDPAARDWPTCAITAYTTARGIRLHRVHEVKACHQAMRMAEAIGMSR